MDMTTKDPTAPKLDERSTGPKLPQSDGDPKPNEESGLHTDGSKPVASYKRPVVSPFNFYQHFKSIFIVPQGPPYLRFLDGLRVLSMLYVHLGHVFVFYLAFIPGMDVHKYAKFVRQSIPHHFILGGTFACDTFFFLGGLLVAYQVSKAFRQLPTFKARFSATVSICLQRYVRLIGLVLFVLLITMFIRPESMKDPFMVELARQGMDGQFGGCRQYYWTVPLLITNIVSEGSAECIGWLWFLSNDYQFFVLGMLLILLYTWNRKVGIFTIVSTLLASLSLSLYIVNRYNFTASIDITDVSNRDSFALETRETVLVMGGPAHSPFFFRFYIAPHIRIQVYLIGLLFGLYLAKKEREGEFTKCALSPVSTLPTISDIVVVRAPGQMSRLTQNFSLTRPTAATFVRADITSTTPISPDAVSSLEQDTSSKLSSKSNNKPTSASTACATSNSTADNAQTSIQSSSKTKLCEMKLHWSCEIIVCLIMIALICLPYYANTENPLWTPIVNLVYVAWSRCLWALCIGCLSFISVSNNLIFTSFLSSKLWAPLSKLSYAFYLMHPLVLSAIYIPNRLDLPRFLSWDIFAYYFILTLVITVVVSAITYVFIETPLKLIGFRILQLLLSPLQSAVNPKSKTT